MNSGAHILCVPRFTNRTARTRVDMTALILYSLATTAAPAVLSRLATRDATRLHVVPRFHSILLPLAVLVGVCLTIWKGVKCTPFHPFFLILSLRMECHTLNCADCKCVPPRLNLSGGGEEVEWSRTEKVRPGCVYHHCRAKIRLNSTATDARFGL